MDQGDEEILSELIKMGFENPEEILKTIKQGLKESNEGKIKPYYIDTWNIKKRDGWF